MKKITIKTSLIAVMLFFLNISSSNAQTTYTYTDNTGTGYWTDIANWSPSYPGININAGDEVIIIGYVTINIGIINYGRIIIPGSIRNEGYIENFGYINIQFNLYNNMGGIENNGTIEISNGGTLTNYGGITNQPSGIIDNFGNIYHYFSGNLSNFGTLSGHNFGHTGNFSNNGVLSPGSILNPIGLYKLKDGYTHNNSTLQIELESITSVDKVAITFTANLSGILNVSLINGYIPTVGDTFTILTAASVSGTFATTNLPIGYTWNVNYTSTNVILEVTSVLNSSTFEVDTFTLYPNPTTNFVKIALNQSVELQNINVFNYLGQKLFSTHENNIDLSNYKTGIYILEVETDKGKTIKKIILQ